MVSDDNTLATLKGRGAWNQKLEAPLQSQHVGNYPHTMWSAMFTPGDWELSLLWKHLIVCKTYINAPYKRDGIISTLRRNQ